MERWVGRLIVFWGTHNDRDDFQLSILPWVRVMVVDWGVVRVRVSVRVRICIGSRSVWD